MATSPLFKQIQHFSQHQISQVLKYRTTNTPTVLKSLWELHLRPQTLPSPAKEIKSASLSCLWLLLPAQPLGLQPSSLACYLSDPVAVRSLVQRGQVLHNGFGSFSFTWSTVPTAGARGGEVGIKTEVPDPGTSEALLQKIRGVVLIYSWRSITHCLKHWDSLTKRAQIGFHWGISDSFSPTPLKLSQTKFKLYLHRVK